MFACIIYRHDYINYIYIHIILHENLTLVITKLPYLLTVCVQVEHTWDDDCCGKGSCPVSNVTSWPVHHFPVQHHGEQGPLAQQT